MTGRKLGRGLDMLISKGPAPTRPSPEPAEETPPKPPEEAPRETGVLQLDPGRIQPNPEQPRKRFPAEELEGLKASMSREGLLQPLLVRKVGEGYQLVAGERRLRAAKELGLDRVPALMVSVGDERLLELALIENIQREDLDPVELAKAYRQLMRSKSWTQDQLAEALGLNRSSVGNTVRILELPDDMQGSLVRGHITLGHAKVLLSVPDRREQRLLYERIAEEKLTVRELEGTVEQKQLETPAKPRKRRPREKKPHIASLEERFREALGTRVRIHEKNGKGSVTIDFYSPEDFERIRERIIGKTR
jgi:ParB family transcriptional regulator, chromosome partitioning protein